MTVSAVPDCGSLYILSPSFPVILRCSAAQLFSAFAGAGFALWVLISYRGAEELSHLHLRRPPADVPKCTSRPGHVWHIRAVHDSFLYYCSPAGGWVHDDWRAACPPWRYKSRAGERARWGPRDDKHPRNAQYAEREITFAGRHFSFFLPAAGLRFVCSRAGMGVRFIPWENTVSGM